MLGNCLTTYVQISFDGVAWLPFGNWNLGRPTHFVHEDSVIVDLKEGKAPKGEGKPLNRNYSIDFGWLIFFVSISLNLEP
jgi:hypothetical protein